MWVLYVALFWIPIGFLLFSLQFLSEILDIDFVFGYAPVHSIALGYFTMVFVGFGTRVILGHSGKTPTADKFTKTVFVLIQFVVLIRIFAGVSPNFNLDYNFWILFGNFLLVSIIGVWFLRFVRVLIYRES